MRTPGRAGALPPPPDRFPQRVPQVTAASPKPEKKTVASAPHQVPKVAPLPKPRPAEASSASKSTGAPPLPPLVPEKKPDSSSVPN